MSNEGNKKKDILAYVKVSLSKVYTCQQILNYVLGEIRTKQRIPGLTLEEWEQTLLSLYTCNACKGKLYYEDLENGKCRHCDADLTTQ